MRLTIRRWLHGLVSATVNGVASGVVLIIADPTVFNIYEGRAKLVSTSIVFGLFGLANYLRQSPLWTPVEDEPEGDE